jgi:hypothetical protein
VLFASCANLNAQVLISLLLGDDLNSNKIEFGLVGGFNQSYFRDVAEAKGLNNYNLGFYFHINLKNDSYLSTGVLVKSNVGATGMPTYPIGNEDFDDLFQDGILTTKMSYFYVPILYHHRFNNRWYLEGGFQPGLRSKAYDIFEKSLLDGDLSYKVDVRDQYARLDAGLLAGIGYKFRKQVKSTSAGINYYYGLVNVSKLPDTTIRNSSLYVYIKIPIGVGTKEESVK